jgi:hypothetical protein
MRKRGSFIDHLARQERVVMGKVGAGVPIAEAIDASRWARELTEDGVVSKAEASAVMQAIRSHVVEAVGTETDCRARVAAARTVFAFIRAQAGPLSEYGPGDAGRRRQVADPSATHYVYRLYDGSGRLLYVGISDRGPVRLVEHYRRKPWFIDVERVEFERYASRRESEDRERHLIRTGHPRYNIQHNGAVMTS